MLSPITMIKDGGIFTVLIMVCGIVEFLLIVVQLFTIRRVDLRSLLWSGIGGMLLMGVLGSIMGTTMAFQAVATASPEMKQTLMAAGISVSLYTCAVALFVAIPEVLLIGALSSAMDTMNRFSDSKDSTGADSSP